jgi:hypothetical protein
LKSARLTPGIEKEERTRGQNKNYCPEANIFDCQPMLPISNSSASRTETSSARLCLAPSAARTKVHHNRTSPSGRRSTGNLSANTKRGFERLKQCCIAEWLEQALNGPLSEQAWTHDLISVSGDEDDGNLLPAKP